jgi:hypothetical protein
MNSLIKNIKAKALKEKIKLGQDTIGVRGKDGQLLVAPFPKRANSASLLFSLLAPVGLQRTYTTHTRVKKFFSN